VAPLDFSCVFILVSALLLPSQLLLAEPEAAESRAFPQTAKSSDPIDCLKSFTKKMKSISEYSTLMNKVENFPSGEVTEEIRIRHNIKIGTLTLEFLNHGHSGIKNNGMTVQYDGTPELNIKLGKATGFSTLVRPLVSAVAGKKMGLTDSEVITEEIFTVNQAGFAFLAKILEMHLLNGSLDAADLSNSKKGICEVSYRPKKTSFTEMNLKSTDDIFDVEERFGQLSYFIFLTNEKLVLKYHKLFDRTEKWTLKIPDQLPAFDLTLDSQTLLPTNFSLYHSGRKVGVYQFSETISK
jgi:hypothetical protein